MNYCIIAYTDYKIDYRVRRYAEALVKSGNRVDIIALKSNSNNDMAILNEVNVHLIQKRNFDERKPHNYLFNILRFFVKGSIFLSLMHLRYRYKVIHIHNVPDFLVFMAVIPKLLGTRIILDIHDILPEFYSQKFNIGFDTIIPKILLFIEKLSIRFSDHVIVANDLWRKKLIDRVKALPQKFTTILNYPNLNYFKRSSSINKTGKYKIIYPGTLSHHHGVDIAIKALTIVKKKIPDVKLVIYTGRISEYRKYLEKLINNLFLEENVQFFEPLCIEKLSKKYQCINVGIVTKRDGIFSSEAFSTKIFDYMAAGIPIIASKTKIDEYYFDDSMIMFFKPDDHEDMARCILELYKNPKKGEFLVNNAKRFVDRNNWEDKKHMYLDLVNSLVNKK